MPKEVVALEVTSNASQAEGSVKSLKAQLKEAQAEVSAMSDKFGETSKQAIEAAKRASQLKDRIGDAKALTDAFNPDKKFQAFSSALSGVAGGFSAVQGAMGLMGAESDNVQKMLLKVQSAMALSQGLSAVTESIDAFKNLGAKIKDLTIVQNISAVAQRVWNFAMSANPIGTIVVAVTALVASITALVYWLKKSSDTANEQAKAVNESSKAIDKLKVSIESANDSFDRNQKVQYDMLKASGANAKALRELELRHINEKIANREATAQTALNTLEKEKNYLATLKSAGAEDETIKKQEETVKKAREILTSANNDVIKSGRERQDIVNKQAVEILQAKTDEHKKELEKQKEKDKKLKDKRDEEHKKEIEDTKKLYEDLRNLKDQNFLSTFKNDLDQQEAKLNLDFTNKVREIQNTKATQEAKNAMFLELQNKYDADLKTINDKRDADAKAKQDAKDERDLQEIEYLQSYQDDELNIIMARLEAENDLERKHAEESKQIEESKFQHKKTMAEAYADILGKLSDVIGKDTATGKAMAVAQATINTWLGATEVLKQKSTLPEPIATISKIANVAAIVSSGIKSVKSILATKVPGGGGGGSAPTMSSVAPIAPQMSQTALNQQMINQVGNASTRAFVVESDVSGNQERIRRLNRAARIN